MMFHKFLLAVTAFLPLLVFAGTTATSADSIFRFWFAAVVFVLSFTIVATEKLHKTAVVLVGAALMLLFVLPHEGEETSGPLPEPQSPALSVQTVPQTQKMTVPAHDVKVQEPPQSSQQKIAPAAEKYDLLDPFAKYVNFDVIFTLAGMMVIVNILSKTGLFQYVAIKAVKIARGYPARTMTLLVLATAFLSAFLDNVTTVLLVVPVTFVVASQMKVSPIPFIMCETLASNIGGTATLIGDPPNLIIGSMAKLSFMDFMVNLAPFILAILLIYCVILHFYYGKRMSITLAQRAHIMDMDESTAITDAATLKRAGTIMLLTIVGFLIHGMFGIQPCVVAMTGAACCLIVCKVNVDQMLEKIEWSTLFFFIGLFILVEGANYAGVMQALGDKLHVFSSCNPLVIILIMMWICGLCVAIINNVSFTTVAVSILMAFMKTVPAFNDNPDLQRLMWWGIALAVCLGGNFTFLGAAANLVVAGLAKQNGYEVTFGKFMKYGTPVTLMALLISSVYIAIRYFMLPG